MRKVVLGVGLALALGACASGASNRLPTFTGLYITSEEIAESGLESAYEILANHREMIVLGSDIAFRGGNNLNGENEFYTRPMVVVDGNRDIGDVTTVLRRIKAEEIALIRLVYASDVGPQNRRPRATGGVIEITTKEVAANQL